MASLGDQDIQEYVNARSDFDLELFVYRTLRDKWLAAQHSGTYIDAVTGKYRQFDVRASCSERACLSCFSVSSAPSKRANA